MTTPDCGGGLRWSRRALADLARIAVRIANASPSAAGELVMAIRTSSARLEQFAFLGRPGALGDTRELIVHRNYILTFRVRADEVQLLQVWHIARDLPRSGPLRK